PIAAGRPEPAWPRRPCNAAGAGVDADYLGHLRASLTLGDPHFERVAGLYRGDPVASQDGGVQKSVARAIRKLDKAEAFFGLEPLDHGPDDGSGGFLEACRRPRPRRRAKVARRRVEIRFVKAAAAARPKIPIPVQVPCPDLTRWQHSSCHNFAPGVNGDRTS